MKIVAVDPGNEAGFAVFDLSSRNLERAELVRGDPTPDLIGLFPSDFVFYIEEPHSRGASDRMGAASLLKHRDNASKWIMLAQFAKAQRIEQIKPVFWKGSINKKIFTQRLERDLTELERSFFSQIKPKGKAHNVLDAIGLGKWAVAKERLK